MIIIAEVTFPKDCLKQTVETLLSLESLPAGIKMVGPFFRTGGDEKIFAIAYFTIDQYTGAKDAKELIKQRYLHFGNVPNFVADVHYWRSVDDSLASWIG